LRKALQDDDHDVREDPDVRVRGHAAHARPFLPTFSFACDYNPVFVRLYAKHLRPFGFWVPCEEQEGAYRRYTGDGSVPGKGEILVWAPHAG
jgi:hypothetical protein